MPIALALTLVACGNDNTPAGYVYKTDTQGIDGAIFTDTAGAADTAVTDATSGDAAAVDAGPTDTGAVDTGPAAACTGSEISCKDKKTPRFCSEGQWLELNPCDSGYACDKGQCKCAGECKAIVQQECLPDIDAIKICKHENNCLLWGIPEACKPGDICVQGACIAAPKTCDPPCPKGHTCSKGQCIPPSDCKPACSAGQVCDKGTCVGTMSCGQIHACVTQYSSGPNDKVNIDACVAKGTAAAQALYAKRKACIALACQKLIDAQKVNEAMLCMYSKCGVEQGECLGKGTNSCSSFANCLSGCKTSAVCLLECHSSASINAVKQWYNLNVCGDEYCGGMSGNAWAQCTTQKCQGPFTNCFGSSGTGGGTWSCKQILDCVKQNCKDKACADQCKAKGSPQGLSDLQSLLDCQNAKCAQYCSGAAASCNACIKIYCPQQNQVCGYAP